LTLKANTQEREEGPAQPELSEKELDKIHPRAPGRPLTPENLEKPIYVLYYRKGNEHVIQAKHFQSDLRYMHQVISRCKTHCEKVGIRFIKVLPFLVDLDEEERRHLGPDSVDQ
jgi:hypothetical protein